MRGEDRNLLLSNYLDALTRRPFPHGCRISLE